MHGRISQRPATPGNTPSGLAQIRLAVRLALRELRGGLRGFYIFLICLSLGVAAISGVGSLASALRASLDAQGRAILGGDIKFSLAQRRATPDERAFLDNLGTVSETANLRSIARKPDLSDQTLVELKAVDGAYPLYGDVTLEPKMRLADTLAAKEGRFGAAAEPALLARLGISIGDEISVGEAKLVINATVTVEPDKLSTGLTFGPRLFISPQALAATGVVREGSLVRWRYAVRLPAGVQSDNALKAVAEQANKAFPDAGWRIEDRRNAAPRVETAIDRFAQILALVGLTALIVGGVGIANAVHAYMDMKARTIAVMKCIGAPGRLIFLVYLVQILLLALGGIAVGIVVGAFIPIVAELALAGLLPLKLETGIYSGPLILALAYGFLTALAFSVWPLGRARDIKPASLFRDLVAPSSAWPRPVYVAMVAGFVVLLAILAITTASDRRIALIYVGAAAGAFLLLRIVAAGIMALARRAPMLRSPEARLAVSNIHRPGALTPSVVLSLGLGLTLLVTLALIDVNLNRELSASIPDQAPSFFFVDVQRSEADAFNALLKADAPDGKIETVPMLRGRLITLGGRKPEDIDAPPDTRWALRGDRGITYSDTVPEGSTLDAGNWWPKDYDGPPLVSFESELAQAFGIGIGDEVVVNVLGRTITAKIANLRKVDWESLGINFVMVFSPNTFAGAPHMVLTTLSLPEAAGSKRELGILRSVAKDFPQVTSVRVKEALDQAAALLSNVMWAIRAASSITILSSILVLAGALAAGHRARIYDAVVLKALGATRKRLLAAYGLEFALLGLATSLFALIAGSIAAWFVLTQVMHSGFVFSPLIAGATALAAGATMIVLGLVATWRILGRSAASVLRSL